MELQQLEQRLRYVEQSVAFWKRLSLLFMACFVATLIVGWSAKDQILRIARIEAEEIWLRDAKGVYKSKWTANAANNYSSLSWFGKDTNNVLMTLAVSNVSGDAGLLVKNRMGKSQLYIGHEDDSVAKMFVFSRDGDKLVTSLIRSGQEATLTMNGARNVKEQTMLTSRGISSGAAVMKSVAVLDSAGKLAALISTKEGKDANRFVALYDQQGTERGTFFVNKLKSSGGYALFDNKGRNRIVSGTKPDGVGYFIVVDSTGAIQWKSP
jgi:hypothetical protein